MRAIRAASFLLRPLGVFLRGGHCPIVHGSVAISRRARARVGAYRELPAEDHDLWLRCLDAASTASVAWSAGIH